MRKQISTHTPAWGVTDGVVTKSRPIANFNSHARVGRDDSGFTLVPNPEDFNSHARVGRDRWAESVRRKKTNFNSHARVGRDPAPAPIRLPAAISTHTPAWGVTICMKIMTSIMMNFNSHARVGRDAFWWNPPMRRPRFQLTRPRGA